MVHCGSVFDGVRFDIDNVQEEGAAFASHGCQTERFVCQDVEFDPEDNTRKLVPKFRVFFAGDFFLGNVRD